METKINKNIIELGKNVLRAESEAIDSLKSSINENFENAIKLILNSKGKVVITGVGKSAIIAQKISATFNSTGQLSAFLHGADALHGDIGILDKRDILITISKSGETEELLKLLPYIKHVKCKHIAISGNIHSTLATEAHCTLDASVAKEACTNNLAPTTSTTAALVMGDALAICLMELREFKTSDFARNHPAGSLGKKTLLKVGDIYSKNAIPAVLDQSEIEEVIIEISSKRLGATAVLDKENNLLGIITDGDLRRMLRKHKDFRHLKAVNIMTASPKTIKPEAMAVEALSFMKENNITQLIVAEDHKALGFIHLHDLLKEGLG
ncbi:MAG: KpsF/GutQ family sugar-phosphate isomerase [Cytophagales bacterium]|nr:KpsF/GutQ family sugar-phosphate isomerase [Cytophagales bacterium]